MRKTDKQSKALAGQLDQWVFYGFLAVAVVLPLAMSRITYDQFDIAKVAALRVLTLIMLSLWVWKVFNTKDQEVRWSKLDFAVIGFLLLAFISTFTAIHVPTAIHGKYKRYEGLLTFINYGIIYFLALQIFTSSKRLSVLSKTIALTGGLVSLYGVMQYMGLDPLPWATLPFEERRSFSTFGNPDLLGGFLVIAVPLAVVEYLKAQNTKDNALMSANLFLVLLCLLTAFVRGAWVGSAVALIVLTVISAKAIFSKPRKVLVMFAVLVSIFAVVAIYSASTGHNVLNLVERLKSMTQITEGSAGSRLEIWKAGLSMIKEDPLFGLGPDTFRLGSERYETLNYVEMGQGKTVADNAHNYVIQLAAGVGVPATLLLIAFFIVVIVFTSRHCWKMQGNERLTYSALIASAIGYLIHLLFGVSITGSTGVFWVIIGALAAALPVVMKSQMNKTAITTSFFKITIVVSVIVTVISSYYGVSMYVADYYYAKAAQLANTGDYENAITSFEKALDLYKNGRYYDGYGMFIERLGSAEGNPETLNRATLIYTEGASWEPNEADHYVFLAGVFAKLATGPGDPLLNDAIRELNSAIRVRPNSVVAHFLLGNIYMYQTKYREAINAVKFVAQVSPKDIPAYEVLAGSYEGLGNKSEARKYYKKLLSLQPNHQKAKEALAKLDNRGTSPESNID